jgi:hypothetical protein
MKAIKSRSEKIARIISYIFLPPFLNIGCFIAVISQFEPKSGEPFKIFIYTSIFTAILPILVFLLFLKKGTIADPDARERNERHLPYIVFALIILIGYLLIPWQNHADEIRILFLIYLLNLVFLFFVNLFWKMSAHTMGAGGFVGALLVSFGFWGIAGFPIILILSWARYKLKCHTIPQISFGAFFGVLNTLILFKVLALL